LEVLLMADTLKIKYIHGDESIIDEIRLMWQTLNEYHCRCSTNFTHHYCNMTFEKRKADLKKKAAGGAMRIDIAVDEATGNGVGYIVSSVNPEKTGEIESVFVSDAFRGMGIGDSLIKKALAWMEQKGAETKIVEVSIGNESAFDFYGRYDFLPRKTVLLQRKGNDAKI
jgi:ribosomal protein S18 acetylase RimI-like enzyme